MDKFQSKRVTHEYVQTNIAPPEKVFPLLCPVREAEWVPDWQYHLIHSNSGIAEDNCVFTTPNQEGPETTWVVIYYLPEKFRIGFVWVWPGLIAARIDIALSAKAEDRETTLASIRYTYTGLSERGNRELERYDESWFRTKMEGWQTAINHYLRTGKLVGAPAWE